LSDVASSRKRLSGRRRVPAPDREARPPDGAQQQLVGAAGQARAGRGRSLPAPADPPNVDDARPRVEISSKGALPRPGIYHALLASRRARISAAAAGAASSLPLTIRRTGSAGCAETESAVYFSPPGAPLQNGPARRRRSGRLRIELSQPRGFIGFEVSDDGCGVVPAIAVGSRHHRDSVPALPPWRDFSRVQPGRRPLVVGHISPALRAPGPRVVAVTTTQSNVRNALAAAFAGATSILISVGLTDVRPRELGWQLRGEAGNVRSPRSC